MYYPIIECKGHAVIRYLKAIGWRPEPKKKPVAWDKMRQDVRAAMLSGDPFQAVDRYKGIR